jgi:hypothetical protein
VRRKLPDPDIQTGPWEDVRDGVQRNLDALAGAALGLGGLDVAMRFGTAAGAWPGGSPRANTTTIPHGLGRVPIAVVATVVSSPSATWFPVVATVAYATASFGVTAVTSDGSSPALSTQYTIVWIAIG